MPNRPVAATVRSAPMAPMLERFSFSAALASRIPEKLVAANAESLPILSACAISASTRVVGSPHAWPQTMCHRGE